MTDSSPRQKILDFGAGELVDVSYLERLFHISRRTAIKYLRALHIQPLYIASDVFFSLSTFKRILYVLSRPGSPGFIFPGSKKKNDPRVLHNPDFLVEVTPDILRKAEDPFILAEMSGASGRDIGLLRKFAAKPTTKEKSGPATDKT